jgi:hypothetical protein
MASILRSAPLFFLYQIQKPLDRIGRGADADPEVFVVDGVGVFCCDDDAAVEGVGVSGEGVGYLVGPVGGRGEGLVSPIPTGMACMDACL